MPDQLVTYPISLAQQRILHIEQLFPNTPINNLTGYSIYNFEFDFNLLSEAVNLFAKKHDASRIRFILNEEEGIEQFMSEDQLFNISVIDFTYEVSPEKVFEAWVKEQSQEVFDWKGECLIRFKFFRIRENHSGYFVNVHHSIADGWSIQLLTNFISETYTKLLLKGEAEDKKHPLYIDYLTGERDYLKSKRFEKDENFWKNKLRNFNPDYHVREIHKIEGEQVIFNVDQLTSQKIRDFASQHQLSLPTLLVGLTLLQQYKLKNSKDIGLGLPVFNHVGVNKNCFGMMTTTLPLLLNVSSELSIIEFFKMVHRESKMSMLHQSYPYELILKEYQQIQRGVSGLFEICVNYYNTNLVESATIQQAEPQLTEIYTGFQIFPLYLVIKEWSNSGQMKFVFNYKTSLYKSEEVKQIYEDVIGIFNQINHNTDLKIEALNLRHGSYKREESNQMLFENVILNNSNKISVESRFPMKSEKELCQQPISMQTLTYEIANLEVSILDKIVNNNYQIDAVFYTLLLDLLRRYNQNDEVGIALLHKTKQDKIQQEQFALIQYIFDTSKSIRLNIEQVNQCLYKQNYKLVPVNYKTEVLAYIGVPHQLNTIESTSYNIALGLELQKSGILLHCNYNASLFDVAMIDKICLHFEELLKTYFYNLETPLSQSYFLPETELDQLLKQFNDNQVDLPKEVSLIEKFETYAEKFPDAIAVKWNCGEITYNNLNEKANRLANILVLHGVKSNFIVPIMIERSPELLIGIFGILKAGGAYLPIDPTYPLDRINYILNECESPFLLTNAKNKPEQEVPYKCILLDDSSIYDTSPYVVKSNRKSEDLAYVIYTSGSTGNPKGVMINHIAALNRIEWMQSAYPIAPGDVILQKTSICFDVSVWELFWWSMTGATCYLLEPNAEREPERICQAIKSAQVSVIHFVPSMLTAFLKFLEDESENHQLNSLQYVFASGEELMPNTVNHFNKLLSNTRLINLYGPTEAAIDVSYYNLPQEFCEEVFIGKAISNIQLYVLDAAFSLNPIGMAGELCIGGIGLACGYLKKEELTNEKFIENPFAKGKKLYRTGDLARYLPSGELKYLGRIDHQVKLNGYRIELREIELTLAKHPVVEEAIVLVIPDSSGHQKLYAFITPKIVDLKEVRVHLEQWLPNFMIPSKITSLIQFPLTTNGKIDRAALKDIKNKEENIDFVAPSTNEEKIIAEIWTDVLKLQSVGITDNFFSIGGDSIKYVSLLSKAKKQGFSFSYQQLFESPTIKELLAKGIIPLNDAGKKSSVAFDLLKSEDKHLISEEIENAYPLSVLQAGLIYQSEIQKGTAIYFDVFSYRIKGVFNQELFVSAVNELTRRHEIIRTTYHLKEYSEFIQKVHKVVPTPLTVVDLRNKDKVKQDKEFKDYIYLLRENGIDWEQPGLIRFHIHHLEENEYMYTVSFHDSALDGWSVNLMHTNLFELYYDLINGNKQIRYDLPVKFRDFIELEKIEVTTKASQIFWDKLLDNSVFTALPRWNEPNKESKVKVDYKEVKLLPSLSEQVKKIAQKLSVPVKSVLLAAHCRVLSALSGNEDVMTGYEISGRPEQPESEKVLGLFLNTIPFRVKCSGNTWAHLIKEVHHSEMELLPYRRYPMSQMKIRRGNHHPLFESVFNFTHFHILKKLRELDDFDLIDVRMEAETEFVFRAEFSLNPFSDDLMLWLHYHSNEFSNEQIEVIAQYYVKVLELMTKDENALFHMQSILSEQELSLQLNTFNDNKKPFYDDDNLVEIFEKQVILTPDAIAVRYQNSNWTYNELNEYSNKIANYLISNGLEQEQLVAVSMQRTHYWMATCMGILKVGGVYLPLDSEWPAERIALIQNKTKVQFTIVDKENEGQQPNQQSNREKKREATICIHTLFNESIETQNPNIKIRPENLAYILFTSGSTGEPKGVMIEHQGMLNHLFSKVNDLNLQKTDIIAQNASQCFDISIWQLLSGIIVGAQTLIVENESILEIDKFVQEIVSNKITILELVPSYLKLMLDYTRNYPVPLNYIHYLLVTGEPVKSTLVKQWFEQYPHIPLVNAYGPTEASDDITHHFMYEAPSNNIVPVGRSIQNLNIYILDQYLQLAPIGTKGEVCVSGVGVGRGYVEDLEKTAAVFLRDPHIIETDVRMYKTGDIGRWTKDGIVELFGRTDEQIKLNGYRIELGEIEGQLQKMNGVEEASVIFNKNNNDLKLIAFIVSNTPISTDDYRSYLKEKLPHYMVPTSFVSLDEMPLTSNGKTDKLKLLKMSEKVILVKEDKIPLNDGDEKELAEIWAQILGIEIDQIHANSNFFELGGHSLKAMELSVKTDKKYSINHIFKFPVLSEMVGKATDHDKMDQELLVDFSPSKSKKELNIIACTYAGGNASNFVPLFNELNKINDSIGCYAIEYPRNNNQLNYKTVEETAILIADQVIMQIHTPIVIWGHCSGAAVAIELAKILEQKKRPILKLFIGGKLFNNSRNLRIRSLLSLVLSPFIAVDAQQMTNHQIKKWMIEKSGFKEFEQIGENEAKIIIDGFRHDSFTANSYIKKTILSQEEKIKAQLINVIANDDPLTKRFKSKHKNWKCLSDDTKLIELKSGGHYFIKTEAEKVAKILLEELDLSEIIKH